MREATTDVFGTMRLELFRKWIFAGAAAIFLSIPPASAFLIERSSVSSAGVQGNQTSYLPAISADGRFVAFQSDASNLVPKDKNAETDIFVRDRLAGVTERVSVDSAGNEGLSLSSWPAINADGRYVAFASYDWTLVPGDTNGQLDVFVRDRLAGTTERVSVDSAGNQGNGASGLTPALSADGRYVAFGSDSSNLVLGDTNGYRDVFVHDRLTGATERVSVDNAGNQGNRASMDPLAISADGRLVAFSSYADNLVAGDTNGTTIADLFVHDRLTGATERVSVDSAGNQSDADSYWPALSADGRYVAFQSHATNLVPGDTNGCTDVFVHDRLTATTERVSIDSAGNQSNERSGPPAISPDGRYVVFSSLASNLVAGDTNNAVDVFVHDRLTGTTERVSLSSTGSQGNNSSGDLWVNGVGAAGGGRYVVFDAFASNLVKADTNKVPDVFVSSDCTQAVCGDGVFDFRCGEQCDDGNTTSGDGCSATCQSEFIPGSAGRGKTQCLHEWRTTPVPAPDHTGAPQNQLVCTDGDPTCDFGQVSGECTFHVALCFNVPEARFRCAATNVETVQFQSPPEAQPKDTTDAANRDALETALGGLGGSVRGRCTKATAKAGQFCATNADCDSSLGSGDGHCAGRLSAFTPPLSGNTCTSFVPIRVPLQTSHGVKAGSKKLVLLATPSNDPMTGRKRPGDRDTLTLVCQP